MNRTIHVKIKMTLCICIQDKILTIREITGLLHETLITLALQVCVCVCVCECVCGVCVCVCVCVCKRACV